MRILMLSEFYHPIIGGVERIVQDLSVELAQRGHEVSVATLWHEGLPQYEVDRGVQIFRVGSTMQRAAFLFSDKQRRHTPPWPDPETVWALRQVIAKVKPEIVHAHNWLVFSYLPLKWQGHAKLVMTLHDYSLSCAKQRLVYQGKACSGPGRLKCLACSKDHYGAAKGIPTAISHRLMSKLVKKSIDMFLPVSSAAADGNGVGGTSLPYHVIPDFMPEDIAVSDVDIEAYTSQLPEKYILFVGDLSYDKGAHVLLKAYAALENAPPLVLIGRKLPDTPSPLPSNAIWLKSWPHAAVMEAWRRCTMGIVPSIVPETFGVVAIEAMSAGHPVIASRIGGLPDIVVDGETGLLVAPGEAEELKIAIQRLLADEKLCEQMGQAGQQRVKQFQARAVLPRVEQEYQNLLAAKQSGEL